MNCRVRRWGWGESEFGKSGERRWNHDCAWYYSLLWKSIFLIICFIPSTCSSYNYGWDREAMHGSLSQSRGRESRFRTAVIRYVLFSTPSNPWGIFLWSGPWSTILCDNVTFICARPFPIRHSFILIHGIMIVYMCDVPLSSPTRWWQAFKQAHWVRWGRQSLHERRAFLIAFLWSVELC